jgi:two-component system sensor histidine kinase PilS (NtrC family)
MQSTFDERNWLAWLVKVRILILTFLLGIELTIAELTPTRLPLRLFLSTIFLWYTISLFYVVLLSFWDEHRMQASLQVLTDLIMISLVVHETGGWDSELNFLYPLAIIVAGILLPRVWATLVAALAFILYGAVLELNYYGLVRSYCTTHPELSSLQAIIFVNLFAYIAVAYLAGQLVAKLHLARVQLKDASGALESLQVLHENIIQSIGSGLITTGLDGRITLVNNAAQKLLEASSAELLDKPVAQLFLDALPDAESQDHAEVRFDAQKSFRKTFRIRVAALNVAGGGASGLVYALDDLTEIRRLEREVRMQDRLAAVGRLAAAIAHEIRNPLTSIAGSVSMLSGAPGMDEEHRRLLDIVTRESQRLNSIITDFLAYSRGKKYHFDKVDLVPLLEDTLTLMRHRMEAENGGIAIVESQFCAGEAWAIADGEKLKQVFWNFSENAVRAMPNSGVLKVSIKRTEDDWQISFADSGTGMTPQQSEKIFEPFQSSFEGGTGLGLAVVYQIVQAHEGKVWARSKPGHGTTFVLRLRRLDAERHKEAKPSSGRAAAATASAASQLASAAAEGRPRG